MLVRIFHRLLVFLPVFLLLAGAHSAYAATATMSLLFHGHAVRIGQEFPVYLMIDSGESYINAAQAKISFSSSVLELVKIDKTSSVFNFWPSEPTLSDNGATVGFIGGTAKGVSGTSLRVLEMRFKAIGSGESLVNIQDAVVSANDGKGTNILSDVRGIKVVSSPTASVSEISVAPAAPVQKPVTTSKALPKKPILKVNTYPNEAEWYNHIGETVISWDLPDDAVKVAVSINHTPRTTPQIAEPELVGSKDFGILTDGVWYAHVQFKNSVGWGEVAHYKISIDTKPPLPFEIEIKRESSDDPAPTIHYHSHDFLAGLSRAEVRVDDTPSILKPNETSEWGHIESEMRLTPLAPGPHTISVKIFDLAENSVEDIIEFEVAPIQTPVIQGYPKISDKDDDAMMWGSALPGVSVVARVFDTDGRTVTTVEGESDTNGHWMIDLKQKYPTGSYLVDVIARDERGAQSYPSERVPVRSVDEWDSLLSLFSVGGITLKSLIPCLIVLIVAGIGFLVWPHLKKYKIFRIFRRF